MDGATGWGALTSGGMTPPGGFVGTKGAAWGRTGDGSCDAADGTSPMGGSTDMSDDDAGGAGGAAPGRPTVNGRFHEGRPAGATGGSTTWGVGAGGATGVVSGVEGAGAATGVACGVDGAGGGPPITGNARVAASGAVVGSASENQSSTSSRRGAGVEARRGTGDGAGAACAACAAGVGGGATGGS
ncbi:hypothetical protein [Agromyces sp. Soil535]|uniref:hypothetical protein n=1 Tax=Agromyces sp. Soil535 TaxID=1736390 RepID=UPI0012E3F1F7|nr:hypothetical protein [Agromyces sp. Soil535]